MRVALGMSGGVDSTVAACLLREGAYCHRRHDADLGWACRPGQRAGHFISVCYGPGERRNLENVVALTRKLGIEPTFIAVGSGIPAVGFKLILLTNIAPDALLIPA